MLKIPKNVMQIGTGSPNVKLYMEDYVHTFLERCQGKETCLAFGQQEEKDGIRYYLIYGVLDRAGRRNPDRRLFYFL